MIKNPKDGIFSFLGNPRIKLAFVISIYFELSVVMHLVILFVDKNLPQSHPETCNH